MFVEMFKPRHVLPWWIYTAENSSEKTKMQLKLLGRFLLMIIMPLAVLIMCVQSLCKAGGCPRNAVCKQKSLIKIWSNKAVMGVMWDSGLVSLATKMIFSSYEMLGCVFCFLDLSFLCLMLQPQL